MPIQQQHSGTRKRGLNRNFNRSSGNKRSEALLSGGRALADRGDQEMDRSWQSRSADGFDGNTMANLLGWVSLGLGAGALFMPEQVSQFIGIDEDDRDSKNLLRVVGAREIASGLGILSGRNTAQWVWGRVAGDMMDLALLGGAMKSNCVDRQKLGAATAIVAGITAVDIWCSQKLADSN